MKTVKLNNGVEMPILGFGVFQIAPYYGTYRAMEEAYRDGKARAIGVSNFYPDRYVDLVQNCEVIPAINQVETHVFNQQIETQQIMAEYGTAVMSWGPFAEGKNNFFKNETLTSIGHKYDKRVAQVAALDRSESLFFSHYDPEFVKYLYSYIK